MIKYSIRGGVEWQIQHKVKSSTVFAMRLHSKCYTLSHNMNIIYSAFTGLLVLHGRTDYCIEV